MSLLSTHTDIFAINFVNVCVYCSDLKLMGDEVNGQYVQELLWRRPTIAIFTDARSS